MNLRRTVLPLIALIPTVALATKPAPKPEPAPQPVATSESAASANAYSGSNISSSGNSDSTSTATAGDASANNSIRMDDRLQAPSVSAPGLFASGVCSAGASFGLSVPGGGVSGGRSKEIQGCERREWYRLLRDTSPALALRIACSDPVVAAVAKDGDCAYTPPPATPAPAPCAVCDAYATKEELNRAFKRSVGK